MGALGAYCNPEPSQTKSISLTPGIVQLPLPLLWYIFREFDVDCAHAVDWLMAQLPMLGNPRAGSYVIASEKALL